MAESRIRGRENSSLDDICAQRECLPDKNLVFFLGVNGDPMASARKILRDARIRS
jgi:hypothetical protein